MDDCIIVVPCYNEAARLDARAFRRFVTQGHPQRFLFVNDGSTDETAVVLERLRRCNPERFDVCHLPRNTGKAEAVRQGVLRGLGRGADMVGFWDADLATPLEAIPEFCKLLRRNRHLQMVMGARVRLLGRRIERRAVRHYLGRLFAAAASALLGLPVYDTQCGAKLFRASADVHALFDRPFRTNWVFDVELLARLIRSRRGTGAEPVGQSVYELPLSRWRDVAGSRLRVRDFLKSFWQLARIYWIYLRPGTATAPTRIRPADAAAAGSAGEPGRRRRAA